MASRRWDEDEIKLALSGQRVPGRSLRACEYIRQRHGVRLLTFPYAEAPYRRPSPEPGKIPWPRWWRTAQFMRAEGYRLTEVARLLGRSVSAVRRAVYPASREQTLLRQKIHNARNRAVPGYSARHKERYGYPELLRNKARVAARVEWREAGGDPFALEEIYRRFDCL